MENLTSIKSFDGSFLVQTKDNIVIDKKIKVCY